MPKPYRFNDLTDQCPLHSQDPVEQIEPLDTVSGLDEISILADVMHCVFLFMADGRVHSGTKQKDTAGLRNWVVLYVVKPDLLPKESQSIRACAARRGVDEAVVRRLVTKLRLDIAAAAGTKARPLPTPR